jgi:hypothetical protein
MSQSHALLRVLRKLHLYLGVFTAPALLFFAFTGALQTFSLHETTQGSSYKPPAWIASLAQLHKKQTIEVPVRRSRLDAPRPEALPDHPEHSAAKAAPSSGPPQSANQQSAASPAPRPKSHLPMKIFFLLVAVGLFLSTLTGIYMAYRYCRSRLFISGLLLAGVVLPVLLLPF